MLGTLGTLFIRSGMPAYVIAGANADDALFIRQARFLLTDRWLGPFDDLTLVKGVGYPFFIALSFVSGIPLKVAETIVYVGTSAAAAVLVARWSASRRLGAILFLALAFNPVLWSEDLSRVIREGLYVSLTLAALLLPAMLFSRASARGRASVALGLATGVVWAWFWLTREEGLWLVPAIAVVVAGGALARRRASGASFSSVIVSTCRRLLGAALVAGVLVSGVAAMNAVEYGRFETVEVKSAPFERAYGALYRVRPVQRTRYVVFPADVRRKVYAVSVAARELRPAFEGEIGRTWQRIGCRHEHRRDCPEILSGWFQWALRDAVAAAGHYRDAAAAAAYYTRLADEIDAACTAKRLECLPPRQTLAPPFEPIFILDAAKRVPQLGLAYWRLGLHVPPPSPSVVAPEDITTDEEYVRYYADMVGSAEPTRHGAAGPQRASEQRHVAIRMVASVLAAAYAPCLLILLVLSPFGLFAMARRADTGDDYALLSFAVACYVGVLSRIALLCYLDVTAIPTMIILYQSSASTLLVIGAVVGTFGWRSARRVSRRGK